MLEEIFGLILYLILSLFMGNQKKKPTRLDFKLNEISTERSHKTRHQL